MKRIRQIYGIVLSLALIVAGICLMLACYQVYSTGGKHPYSAERVAEAFAPISIPVYMALALSVGSLFLPGQKEKQKMEKNHSLMLQKLHEKNDLSGCGDKELVAAILRQQNSRKRNRIITLSLLALGFVVCLIYSLQIKNVYAANSTPKVMGVALVMAVCFGIPCGYGIYAAYREKSSIKQELALMRLVASPRTEPLPAPKATPRYLAYLPYVGILVAVALIVIGYLGDGQMGVLAKAVEICKECVGIG